MAFYLKPPNGIISISQLLKEAEVRLKFLWQLMHHSDTNNDISFHKLFMTSPDLMLYSDCLIEGSHKDRTSHYLLRLASLLNEDFEQFFLESESQLFRLRLKCGGKSSVIRCTAELKRHLCCAFNEQMLTKSFQEFLTEVSSLVKHFESMIKCQNDCQHFFPVPWEFVLPLIRKREVILNRSLATVNCHQLLDVLCSIFTSSLEHGLVQLRDTIHSVADDVRLIHILRKLVFTYRQYCSYAGMGSGSVLECRTSMSWQEIETQSSSFPLCMQKLHRQLLQSGRLQHHARFRYTLFLKDVGVPLQENVEFWRHHYSQPHNKKKTHGCEHTWDNGVTGARYIYGIHHLYGLEGKRINYSSHSCISLQSLAPQPNEFGGCPFNSSNQEELKKELQEDGFQEEHFLNAVLQEASAGRPSHACKVTLKHVVGRNAFSSKHFPGRTSDVKINGFHNPASCGRHELTDASLKNISCAQERLTGVSCININNDGNFDNYLEVDHEVCDIEDLVTKGLGNLQFEKPTDYYFRVQSLTKD